MVTVYRWFDWLALDDQVTGHFISERDKWPVTWSPKSRWSPKVTVHHCLVAANVRILFSLLLPRPFKYWIIYVCHHPNCKSPRRRCGWKVLEASSSSVITYDEEKPEREGMSAADLARLSRWVQITNFPKARFCMHCLAILSFPWSKLLSPHRGDQVTTDLDGFVLIWPRRAISITVGKWIPRFHTEYVCQQ